jgi:hypothetical protein
MDFIDQSKFIAIFLIFSNIHKISFVNTIYYFSIL